jgi:phosphoribosylaminoimidazolecarboxamide formyltransferase/IMP cyclohydrolase
MVRASAKNHAHVGIVTDPSRYDEILDELRAKGALSLEVRRRLARDAFAHTGAYDAEILAWFDAGMPAPGDAATASDAGAPAELPATIELTLERAHVLRYGENPHQVGARYDTRGEQGWWATSVQHGGKDMSYLNVYDTEAAWQLAHSLGEGPAAVVIKHANPCGAAVADDILTAYTRAHECDPVSAFGGIVAVNRPVTLAVAEAIQPVFTEVLIAPAYDADALAFLQEKKKNLRILEAQAPATPELTLRSIDGGFLVQTADHVTVDRSAWQVVTERQLTEAEWADLEFAWRVVAKVTSNSIVLVKDGTAVGIGCGQQNRRDAGRLAGEKAAGRAVGGVYASDAFFPFPDGLEGAIDAGATVVVQPGGSIRDDEVIAAANEAGLAMVFTGERHFRH